MTNRRPVSSSGWRATRPRAALFAVAVVVSACNAGGPPVVEGVRDLDGVPLYVETIGEGESLVLVPGGPGLEHTYFLPGMAGLATTHRIILYDQRGTGRTGGPLDSTNITLDNFLADLDALRREFGLERMHLYGHSFGAYLAMAYATAHPDRLASLILSNPTEPGQRYDAEAAANQSARITQEDEAAITELRESGPFQAREPAAVAEMLRLAFLSTFHDRRRADDLVLEFTPDGVNALFQMAALLFPSGTRTDLWADLHRVTVPVLILSGRSDPTPVEMLEALADSFPDATVRILDNTGHFPFVETPEPYLAAIREFLDRVGSN